MGNMWGARDVYNGPLRVSLPELSFRAGHGRAVIRAVSGVASAHGFAARRRAPEPKEWAGTRRRALRPMGTLKHGGAHAHAPRARARTV